MAPRPGGTGPSPAAIPPAGAFSFNSHRQLRRLGLSQGAGVSASSFTRSLRLRLGERSAPISHHAARMVVPAPLGVREACAPLLDLAKVFVHLHGRKYAPEAITVMRAAFAEACTLLDFGADNPSRAMLAKIVIFLFEDGVTDADQLADASVKEMRGAKPTTT